MTNCFSFPSSTDILLAADRIKDYIHKTPILESQSLNKLAGCKIFFKCENFQKAGAFKSRGASNALFQNLDSAKNYGVATHSSGNHAQALARVALHTGVEAHIVMPENSNPLKIAAVKEYEANIYFCKPTLEAREKTLDIVISKTKAIEIHPYNNLQIITGQATACLELINDTKNLDFIIAPVGGGGLLSGTALASHYFSPNTKVIGAEPENANDAYLSLKSKKIVPSVNPLTIADGLKTSLGNFTFPIILKHVNEIITVSEEEIINSMKIIMQRLKIIIEPSSAVAFAGILKNRELFKNKKVGLIISGGNADIYNF